MTLGVVGKKVGMTRVFDESGAATPVTVIHVDKNRVTAKRAADGDGYAAVQVTAGQVKPAKLSLAQRGHFAGTGIEAGRGLWEFRLDEGEGEELEVGGEIGLEVFEEVNVVDVSGVSIGKGFQGGVKRHNFKMQDATHGNSLSHRAPGSIGQNQTPGRVFKGKKMAGHMGSVNRTIQNLEVVKIDAEKEVIMVRGSVPGPKGSDVIVRPAVKMKNRKSGA